VPIAAATAGFLTFAFSLGLQLVDPTNIGWAAQAGDVSIHFFGWHMFRRGPWTNPAGAVQLWGWPIGTSVGLTDSIPVFAFTFKLLNPVLPTDFQYIGLWLLCCFVLQGLFAALLMRSITQDPALQLLGACLIVMSPAMIGRYGHAALTAHWLVLCALWLYFRTPAQARWLPWALLCSLAAATHPYLAMMVTALMGAAHARELALRPEWTRILARMIGVAACVAVVLWQCGYFVVSSASLQEQGFGYHSMNLLSPLLPSSAYTAGARSSWTATAGQYEGYAYLGAGMLLLMVFAAPILMKWLIGQSMARVDVWRHVPLMVVLAVLLLLALGPSITLGPWTLLEYDARWWGPLTVFRAHGRVFWPLYYVIMLGILACIARLGARPAGVLLCAALALQAWDASALYRALRGERTREFANPLQSRFWDAAPKHYRKIVLYPTGMCGDSETVDFRPFSLIAGREGVPINAGFAARPDLSRLQQYCLDLEREMNLGLVDADTLYVLRRDLVRPFAARARVPAVCTTIDDHGVCVARETLASWNDEFEIMFTVLPSVEELVEFYQHLDGEYRGRLNRPARPMSGSLQARLITLLRYVWYRRGGCTHTDASSRALNPVDGEVRICGDPFARREFPSVDETFDFRRQLEPLFTLPSSAPTWSSHVDLEGEAVWLHRYLAERIGGRDAYGAHVEVQNAIRGMSAEPPR
jgi:hypothetical protein